MREEGYYGGATHTHTQSVTKHLILLSVICVYEYKL